MTRAELIRRFVLNSFCDGYEHIEQITKHIDWVGPACGPTISPKYRAHVPAKARHSVHDLPVDYDHTFRHAIILATCERLLLHQIQLAPQRLADS
jgi:hypothetical protein